LRERFPVIPASGVVADDVFDKTMTTMRERERDFKIVAVLA
jgi:hypothetical protein